MPRKNKAGAPPVALNYYDSPSREDSPPSAALSDTSLEREIRLLRWMIRWLKRNMKNNNHAMARLISRLFRAIDLAHKHDTGEDSLRTELEEAGERVLRMLESGEMSIPGFAPEQARAHLDHRFPVESPS